MSTEIVTPTAQPWTPPAVRSRVGDPGPVEDRGELTIADHVVEKIAAVALGEVDQIGGAARRVLGVPLGSDDLDQRAQVSAAVTGSVVTLDVRCSVAYPAPVARITDQARAHLIDRVGELTGLTAAQVDITVTALTTPTPPNRRELQ